MVEVQDIIKKYGKEYKEKHKMLPHVAKAMGAIEKDTGSAAVQIAMMSKKIAELTEHLKNNQKDFATKRGLLMMVGKRKRLLAYVKNQNLDEYRDLIKKLKIRG